MPLLPPPAYVPPGRLFRNAHVQTVYGGRLRRVPDVALAHERLELPDGDFLDLGWRRGGHGRCAVLTHGLEGSAESAYVRGMARALARAGWDVLAWTLRGCSPTPNRLPRLYHSGATDDLDAVIQRVLPAYPAVALVGFSLGGNLTLKYVGERAVDPRVRAAVAFSVPVDLAASAERMRTGLSRGYVAHFIHRLRGKVRAKRRHFPDAVPAGRVWPHWSFAQFDDRFTAPLHGFQDAADYYARASSRPFLPHIQVPTLLVNALDDPFLGPACFPYDAARQSAAFFLEVPRYGGHCGFVADGETFWSEARAAAFLEAHAAEAAAG